MQGFSELLSAAKSRDEAALTELHDRYVNGILARVRKELTSTLRRRYDTMDLGQSVFLEVLKDLPKFEDRGERAFRNWLYIKAENKVRMKLRRFLGRNGHRREVTMGTEPLRRGGEPSSRVVRREELERLSAALGRLGAEEREVLRLRDECRFSYADVARAIGAPTPNAARMRHARALMALRAQWTSV